MNIPRICAAIATLGPIGYFGASGTVATIVALPFMYGLHALVASQQIYLAIAIGIYAVSIIVVNQALQYINHHTDPSEIVLDEAVGCIFVFWGISLFAESILVGVLLFRVLDIVKFGWIKKAESWANAWGVMGDDLVAALITNIILRVLF